MDPILYEKLCVITAEEREILDGRNDIDRNLYMQEQGSTVNSRKLLDAGKLITIRPIPALSTFRSIPTTM